MSQPVTPTARTVETPFQRHARRPGGKPRAMAIADAEKAVGALSSMGFNLVRSNIELLRRIDSDLAEEQAEKVSLIDEGYRLCVEMAEVASFFQMQNIADVAMNLNELLFRMREANDIRLDAYKVHVEALRIAYSAQTSGGTDKASETLVAHLKKVVAMLPDPDFDLRP